MAIQLNHRQNRITTGSNADTAGVNLEVFNTGALILPKGTEAQKQSSATAGAFRFNTETTYLEYYNGSNWIPVVGGNTEDLKDTAGNMIVDGQSVGGTAVNYVEISNAATGNAVEINAAGTDTDVALNIASQGAGDIVLSNGNGSTFTFGGVGPTDIEFKAGATEVAISANGDMAIRGNIVSLWDQDNKVAEFRHNGGDDALLVEAVTSGILLSVSGSNPKQLFIGQDVDFLGNRVTNIADPDQAQDAATKAYVDAAINGLDWKASVKAATTANITLSGVQTVDGVVLEAGDRVLVKDQTTQTENGIYVVAAGAWERSADADNTPNNEVSGGMSTFVEQGTVNGDSGYLLTSPNGNAVLGTDNLVFTQFYGPNALSIVGGDGIDVVQTGQQFTVTADTDGVTIFATGGTGDQLAVKSTNTTGQVLRSVGDNTQEAEWGALDLANADAVTGVLPEANGGTGESTYAVGDLLVGDATGLAKLTVGAQNTYLKSDGTTLVYASAGLADLSGVDVAGAALNNVLVFDGTNWVDGKVSLGSSDAVDGVLNVQNGGTGINALPQGHLVYGAGASAMNTLTIGASSSSSLAYVLKTAVDGTAPEWGTLNLNQVADVSAPTPNENDALVFSGGEWVAKGANDTDKFVKVNAADTSSGYLADKVGDANGTGALSITVSGDSRIEFSVKTDDTTVGKVGDELAVRSTATAGQVLRSTGVDGDAATWGQLDLANADAVVNVLPEVNGGTGESTYAQGDILVGDATTGLEKLTLGANKTFLKSNGTTVVYASAALNDIDGFAVAGTLTGEALVWDGTNWVNSAIDLANSDAVTGLLPVVNGGTGLGSVVDQGLLVGNGTDALTVVSAGTASTTSATTVLTVNGDGNIAWGTVNLQGLTDVELSGLVNGEILQYNSAEGVWENTSLGDIDKLVRISLNDTTSGYLEGKVSAAGGLSKTIVDAAGDEQLALSVNTDGVTTFLAGDNVAVYGGATAGQVLRAIGSAGTAEWGALDLDNTDAVTGTLGVANGGTNLSTIAARSVLVANTADTLEVLTAEASSFQILRWNNAGNAFEFVDQTSVGGFAFETFNVKGNGTEFAVSATATGDKIDIVGGAGVAVTGSAKSIEFALTVSGAVSQNPATDSSILFFNNGTLSTTSAQGFLDALNVPTVEAGEGLVVQNSAGSFVNRAIVPDTAGDRAGIAIIDTVGSAGNIVVGLDLNGLPETAITVDDFVVFYDASGTVNAKASVSALLATRDATRIQDAAGTTFVDTDEVAGRVVIEASEGKVAEFISGSAATNYFAFDTATSAESLRIEAVGASDNIDIRLVPKGTGEVFIGDAGDGTIQADDTFDLTVAGGNDGGDLVLKGGTSAGTVIIQSASGDSFVTFGTEQTVTHYASDVKSYASDKVVRLQTTGVGTATANFAVPADTTVMFEAFVVTRETGSSVGSNSGAYSFKGVVYNNAGTATVLESIISEVIAETPAGLDAAFSVDTGNLVLTVTGDTGVNMSWTVQIKQVAVVA